MWFSSWLRSRIAIPSRRSRAQDPHAAPRFRPHLEALEERALPSTLYAATASDLIADIKAADKNSRANTIVLTAPTTSPYVLTAADNTKDGATGLPTIKNGVTIVGNGDAIERSTAYFRLFDVASGGSLTLQNLTLRGGLVNGSGVSAEGGAIYNQGTLVLSQVTVLGNRAQGLGSGGGIWSDGSLTVQNSTIVGNVASNDYGGPAFGGGIYIAGGTVSITGTAFGYPYGYGGNTVEGQTAYGGAVYVAAGTVSMSGDTFGDVTPFSYYPGNSAQGGSGSATAGDGYGGALYLAGGSVTLTNDSIQGNYVADLDIPDGGVFGDYGGYGGGIYIASGATVYIDSFTVANTNNNLSNYPMDIYGPYQLLP
jgi:hypothetical protein